MGGLTNLFVAGLVILGLIAVFHEVWMLVCDFVTWLFNRSVETWRAVRSKSGTGRRSGEPNTRRSASRRS